ncbi:MAG TPA: GNAT family N-acetyltransferase [Rhizomicrobium sp.]
MTELSIAIEPPDEDVKNRIVSGLIAFNRAEVNQPERQYFNAVLRDGNGHVQGGIIASVNFDVMRIEEFFVEEPWRRGGHGARLVASAEAEGARRGAKLSCVMTYSWQARPFYEKQGYQIIATLPYRGGEHTLYWLTKSLCA